jgi:hypothetical protein
VGVVIAPPVTVAVTLADPGVIPIARPGCAEPILPTVRTAVLLLVKVVIVLPYWSGVG